MTGSRNACSSSARLVEHTRLSRQQQGILTHGNIVSWENKARGQHSTVSCHCCGENLGKCVGYTAAAACLRVVQMPIHMVGDHQAKTQDCHNTSATNANTYGTIRLDSRMSLGTQCTTLAWHTVEEYRWIDGPQQRVHHVTYQISSRAMPIMTRTTTLCYVQLTSAQAAFAACQQHGAQHLKPGRSNVSSYMLDMVQLLQGAVMY